jgi:peptide/nickel transport system substrate-binding protein
MKKIVSAFGALVLAVTIAGCAPPEGGDEGGGDEQANASVTVVLTGEYTGLNNETAVGNTAYNATVNYLLANNWAYFDKDLNWVWNEDAVVVEKVSDEPLVIKYTISDKSKWSDGTPVTGADIVLHWAGISTNKNDKLEDSQIDEETGQAHPNADQVYFDGGDGVTVDVKEPPTINPDNPKEVTVTWSKFVPDWKYSFASAGIPAHKVGQIALGIEDATEAAQAVADAITDTTDAKKADLVKVANHWSTAYDFTALPDNPDLLVVDGPYEINEVKEGEYISLKKRADYDAGPIPQVGNVIFRFISDANAARQALENGEVDLIQPDAVTVDLVDSIKAAADKGIEYKEYNNGIFEHVDLQVNAEAGDSPFSAGHYGGDEAKAILVRQAFLKALPREEILDKIIRPTNPSASVMNSFTSLVDNPSYDQIIADNHSSEYPGSDIEAAKALLKEAGVETPIKVSLVYMVEKPSRVQQYQLIAEALKEAGFEVEDAGLPGSEVGAAYASGKYDILMFGWQLTNTSFSNSKANYVTDGQNNFTKFSNEEEDALWDQVTQTDDVAKQTELVTQAEQILWDSAFGAPLYQFAGFLAWNSRVKNVNTIPIASQLVFNFWEWEVTAPAADTTSESPAE